MNPKSFLIIFIVVCTLLGIVFIIQFLSVTKDDVIIRQNDKEILVKKYKTHISLTKTLKSFECTIDSSFWRYPQNKILCDGILVKAKHNPHEVIVKTTNNEDVTECFSCSQIEEFKSKIGQRIIITKVFYPRERIFYKFP